MPTYRQSVGDNITYLQQQIHRQGTAPLGPVSVGPGEGHLRFENGSHDTFVAAPDGARVRFRGGLQGLTDRLENDATALEDHTALLGDHIRRLNTVDGRLDGHDATLTSHGNRLGSAESRLDGHDSTLASHGSRLNGHDSTLSSHGSRLDGHDSSISSHNTRINNAQSAANTANSRASSLESRASTLESNISSHNTRINNAQSAANAARTRADNAYALAQDALAAGNDAKRHLATIDAWLRRNTGYPNNSLIPQ